MKKSTIWEDFDAVTDDEELDELRNDPLLLATGQFMRDYDCQTAVIQPKELKNLDSVLQLMREQCAGEDVQVSYRLYEPYKFCGAVEVLAKRLWVRRPEALRETFQASYCLEVTPKTDGTVLMDFSFNQMTRPIG